MKKLLTVALVALFTLSSCGGFNNLTHIEDKNGEEDYSLATLTDSDLLTNNPHGLFELSASNTDQNGKYTLSCQTFSGVSDLKKYTLNKDSEYTFHVESNITKGNGNFFVYQSGKKIKEIGIKANNDIKLSGIDGTIAFRLAGESASINVTIYEIK